MTNKQRNTTKCKIYVQQREVQNWKADAQSSPSLFEAKNVLMLVSVTKSDQLVMRRIPNNM